MLVVQEVFRPRGFGLALVTLIMGMSIQPAGAVSLQEAGSDRTGFTISGVDETSYDGAGFDTVSTFTGTFGSNFQQFSSFDGGQFGTELTVTLLAENACYDGVAIPGLANEFGVLDADGNFQAIIEGLDPIGAANQFVVGADEEFTFALQSPQTVFSSIDAQNGDEQAHLIGLTVEKAGSLTIDPANLHGASLTYDLLAGDIVFFIEDMLAFGNNITDLVPANADFDYQDMIVVVRGTPVPEPGTVVLLGLALLGLILFRRKSSSLA